MQWKVSTVRIIMFMFVKYRKVIYLNFTGSATRSIEMFNRSMDKNMLISFALYEHSRKFTNLRVFGNNPLCIRNFFTQESMCPINGFCFNRTSEKISLTLNDSNRTKYKELCRFFQQTADSPRT
jgi:hypothetical protein